MNAIDEFVFIVLCLFHRSEGYELKNIQLVGPSAGSPEESVHARGARSSAPPGGDSRPAVVGAVPPWCRGMLPLGTL